MLLSPLSASTLQMALAVGLIKSSGVLFVAFQERFQSTSAETSLLSTVHNAVYSVSGVYATLQILIMYLYNAFLLFRMFACFREL